MLVFVLCHRLFQVFKFNDPVNQFKSLLNYRDAASAQTTFHLSLLQCDQIFKKELEDAGGVPPGDIMQTLVPS